MSVVGKHDAQRKRMKDAMGVSGLRARKSLGGQSMREFLPKVPSSLLSAGHVKVFKAPPLRSKSGLYSRQLNDKIKKGSGRVARDVHKDDPNVDLAVNPPPRSHQRFVEALLSELQKRDPDGARVQQATDVEQVVSMAADQVLDPSTIWSEHLGAFYGTETVRALLGDGDRPVSRQAVSGRRGLLALKTTSGQVVYPAFQFRGRALAPGLAEVLDVLPPALVSPWTVASWLSSAEVSLHGERPIDVLFDGHEADVAAVQAAAKAWAAGLGS